MSDKIMIGDKTRSYLKTIYRLTANCLHPIHNATVQQCKPDCDSVIHSRAVVFNNVKIMIRCNADATL